MSNKIPFVAIIVFICHWKVFVESRNSVEKSWISKMGINHEHDSWFADYYSVNKGVNSPTPFLVLVQKCTDLGYASTLHWRVTVEPRRVVIIWSWTLTRGWTRKKYNLFKYWGQTIITDYWVAWQVEIFNQLDKPKVFLEPKRMSNFNYCIALVWFTLSHA